MNKFVGKQIHSAPSRRRKPSESGSPISHAADFGTVIAGAYSGRVYEEDLDRDSRWALSEGSRFFEGKGSVQQALAKVAKRFDELGIPYCVAGGMALFHHGYRRFTEDIDLLVTREGLKEIHSKLTGLGYLPPFARSKNLRDTELGVRIEFLVAGDYPGDGKPKPVSFPNPAAVAVEHDGVKYLSLPRLVELKLASGMTNPGRLKDLSDVIELIKLLSLPKDFADQLDAFVRPKYLELWKQARIRYIRLWRNKWLTAEANSIDDMVISLREAADLLAAMRADGVALDPEGGTADDEAYLVTTDLDVAKKYDMHDETEFWSEDEAGEDQPQYSEDNESRG